MSHISLYRKYRPQTFDQVLGQDIIVNTLQSALKSETISHAYLFAGSRGTGKTSIARIFAKELGTSPNDLYEIDAASNNGVDEMRELTSGVSTLPFDSKYKVYILDEVHMLSKASFNALLKTLEEPPKHAIFILATTELHKVIPTIVSRCQVFEFKKPSLEILQTMIKQGAANEDFSIDDESALLIAQMGDGAFRDTWGMLERVMRISQNNKITIDDVLGAVGKPTRQTLLAILESVIDGNLESFLEKIHTAEHKGITIEFIIQGILEFSRLVLLYRFAPKLADTLATEIPEDIRQQLIAWSKEKNSINAQLVTELLKLADEVKKTSMPIIPVELAFMRILGNNS
jgi:DNA polymerase-3 subunit gamma/tau